MVNPNQPINPINDNKDVKETDDRYLKKDKPLPSRDFREVADEINERRYRDDEEILKSKKKSANKRASSRGNERDESDRPISLFELAARSKRESSEADGEEESNANLTRVAALSKKSADEYDAVVSMNEVKENSKDDTKFMREQSDLAYVNPLAQQAAAVPGVASSAQSSKAALMANRSMQEIIDQIVKEVYTLELNGKNETIISLKGPLLNDAHLILSEFNHARGEFNITFDNLTQAAKTLLDRNQNALIEDLSKKGYTVHILTTTTISETPQIDGTELSRNRQDDADEEREGQKRQNRDQEES